MPTGEEILNLNTQTDEVSTTPMSTGQDVLNASVDSDLYEVPSSYNPNPLNLMTAKTDDVYAYGGNKLGMLVKGGYDKGYYPDVDIEDIYGQNQTRGEKWSNGFKQLGMMHKNSYQNHFASYGRQFQALKEMDFDKLWNDEFGKESAHLFQAAQNLYPIHSTKQQQAAAEKGGWFQALRAYMPLNINATNSWTRLIGQAGFTTGTIAGVFTENAALYAASMGTGAGNVARAPASASALIRSFWRIGTRGAYLKDLNKAKVGLSQARTLSQAFNAAKDSKALNSSFAFYRMATAAMGEGAIEANMSAIEFIEDQKEKYIKKHGYEPSPETMDQIYKNALAVGNTVFTWNLPVLMASNYAVFGNMFRAKNFVRRAPLSATAKVEAGAASYNSLKKSIFPEGKFKGFYSKTSPYFKKAGKVIGIENIGEGMEELMQGVGARAAAHQYDMMSNSDSAKGGLAFIESALGEELWNTLGTREGWDEFFAGFFTGGGIKMAKSVGSGAYSVTPWGKKQKEDSKKSIETAIEQYESGIGSLNDVAQIIAKTSPVGGATNDLLSQFYSAFGISQAMDENDIKKAHDLQIEAKISFYHNMLRHDKLDDVLNTYSASLKQMQETDPDMVKEMLGDRNIDTLVEQIREEGKAYGEVFNTIDKEMGNPYTYGKDAEETMKYMAFEQAKRIAAGTYTQAENALSRAKSLVRDIESDIDRTIIDSLADPDIAIESANRVSSLIEQQKKNIELKKQSGEAISDVEKEQLKKDEALLKALNFIKNYEGSDQNKAIGLLKVLGADSKNLPKSLLQNVTDLISLEKEGAFFKHLHNLLQNKEYFDEFGTSFVVGFSKYKNKVPISDTVAEDVIGTGTIEDEVTDDEYAQVLEETGEEGILAKLQPIKEEFEKIKSVEGGWEYNGKTYKTKLEAVQALVNSLEDSQKELLYQKTGREEETYLDLLIKNANFNLAETEEEAADERLSEEPEEIQSESSLPKTIEQVQKEKQQFFGQNKGKTILHNFINALSNIWRGKSLDYILKKLSKTPISEKITDLLNNTTKGKTPTLVTFNMMSYDFFKANAKEGWENSENIEVISDDERIYITASVPEGGSVTEVIENELGFVLQEGKNWTQIKIRKDGKLIGIQSDYTINDAGDGLVDNTHEEILDAISDLRVKEKLLLRVADSEYNRQLLESLTEEKKEDVIKKLAIQILVKRQGKYVAVGVLRATDSLFQSKVQEKTLKTIREKMLASSLDANTSFVGDFILGQTLGTVEVSKVRTDRNTAYDGKQILWTSLATYMDKLQNGWKPRFFYVNEEGKFLKPNGQEMTDSELVKLGRRDTNYKKGAIYMTVYKTNARTGVEQNHTVQLHNTDNNSRFSFEEFKSRSFLSEDSNTVTQLAVGERPFLSKRVIADTSSAVYNPNGEIFDNSKQLAQETQDDLKDAFNEIETETQSTEVPMTDKEIENEVIRRITSGEAGAEAQSKYKADKKESNSLEKKIKGKQTKLDENLRKFDNSRISYSTDRFTSDQENIREEIKTLQTQLDNINDYYAQLVSEAINSQDRDVDFTKTVSKEVRNITVARKDAKGGITFTEIKSAEIQGNQLVGYVLLGDGRTRGKVTVELDTNEVEGVYYYGYRSEEYKQALIEESDRLEAERREKYYFLGDEVPSDAIELVEDETTETQQTSERDAIRKSTSIVIESIGDTKHYLYDPKTIQQDQQDMAKDGLIPARVIVTTNEGVTIIEVKLRTKALMKAIKKEREKRQKRDVELKQLFGSKKMTEPEKRKFLIENGKLGESYTDSDGVVYTVIERVQGEYIEGRPNSIVVRKSKGKYFIDQVYIQKSDGTLLRPSTDLTNLDETERDKLNEMKGNVKDIKNPTKEEIIQIARRVMNNLPLSFRQYATINHSEENRKKVEDFIEAESSFAQNISFEEIEDIKRMMLLMGHASPESFFIRLIIEYQRGLREGTPYNSLDELLDNANISEYELGVFNNVVSNGFLGLSVWHFLTQADVVYDYNGNEDILRILEGNTGEVQDLRDFVENTDESLIATRSKVVDVRKSIFDRLNSITEDIGLQIVNYTHLLYATYDEFKDTIMNVLDALNPTFFIKNILALPVKLGADGAVAVIDNIIKSKIVSAKSRGKNPKESAILNGIYLDFGMYKQGEYDSEEGTGRNLVVRNEEDGLFIEVKRVRGQKLNDSDLAFKQKMLSLLNLAVSNEYILAYKKINGNLDKLIERANAEIDRQRDEIPNAYGYTDYTNVEKMKEDAIDKTDLVITENKGIKVVEGNDIYIKIGGVLHRNILNINNGRSAYAKDSIRLNPRSITKSLNAAGISPEKLYERDKVVRKTIGRLENVRKKIQEISCNL